MIVSRLKAAIAAAIAVAIYAICIGMSLATAAATTLPPSAQTLTQSGVVYNDTRPATTTDYLSGVPAGTIMVITPGTDDTTLRPRINTYVSDRDTLVVNYPQSAGPVIAGQSGKPLVFAPTYDKSKEKAVQGNLFLCP